MTKRVPGAKRGRPRKPKPPAKRSGRKPVAYIGDDHDRHAIALTDALLQLRIASSENAACKAAASLRIGVEVLADRPDDWTQWQKRAEPGIAATWKGYVTTLDNKRRKYLDARSMAWRLTMMVAVRLGLRGTDKAKTLALLLAWSVGERAFAERVLFAMIDANSASASAPVPE